MPSTTAHPGRAGLVRRGLLCILLGLGSPLAAQELPIRRDYPGSKPFECPSFARPRDPGAAERAQATQLASSADQAVILGDLDRARALLTRAVELDPASSNLSYRLGRVLDDLGDRPAALSAYCGALTLSDGGDDAGDARQRLEALVAVDVGSIPEAAKAAFRMGLEALDGGYFEDAASSFVLADSLAPTWPDPSYDRAIALARLGRTDEAASSLQHYLQLRPDADDVAAVSQRIGQLEGIAVLGTPDPSTALTLGVLFPGLGQFYSGRALGGTMVLTLAGGAVAAGVLVRKREIRCLVTVGSGETCPPDQVVSEALRRPYLSVGVAVAAGVSLIAAVEAFVKARGRRNAEIPASSRGPALRGPSVVSRGGRAEVRVFRLTFR